MQGYWLRRSMGAPIPLASLSAGAPVVTATGRRVGVRGRADGVVVLDARSSRSVA